MSSSLGIPIRLQTKFTGFYLREKRYMNKQVNLAEVRTDLANQRTLLAYVRTSLSFFISAAALAKLYEGLFTFILCGFLAIAGAAFMIAGIRVYRAHAKIQRY